MKLRVILGLLASLLAMATAPASSQPPHLPEWDAGVRGGVPELTVAERLTAAELQDDPAAAIQRTIDERTRPGVILLPAGEFRLSKPLHLRSGVVLRGSGELETRLVFDLSPPEETDDVRPAFGAVRFAGELETAEHAIVSDPERGDVTVRVETPEEFEAGDLLLVFSDNDPELMYTDPRWDRDWARESLAQIVAVVAVEGDTLRFDTPLRLDYKPELEPRTRRIEPIKDAGLENLLLRRDDGVSDNVVGFEAALNCWIIDCETVMAGRGHIWINYSRYITAAGNHCHQAIDYGGGGNGYGIVAGNVATDCLVENNVLHSLRHALMTKRGSNGNVFAYNYSYDRRRDPAGRPLLCDISVHGHYSYQNLFEGNAVEFVELADYWGPTGPYTTLFRNRVQTRIEINDHSHQSIVWANEVPKVQTDGTSEDLVLRANVSAGEASDRRADTIPASLYRQQPPAFWPEDLPWPAFGPDVPAHDGPSIPAQLRAGADRSE